MVAELMRDVEAAGIVGVDDFRTATRLRGRFERVFAFGGGAPRRSVATGPALVVPTISLWALVPGLRGLIADSQLA
jgi:hypothetical protein